MLRPAFMHSECALVQESITNISNFSQAAKSAGVPVIMDAGGMDAPVPRDLLSLVDIFSPNETELARLTGMPTETFEQISQAAGECHKMVRCLNWISFICFSIFLQYATSAYSFTTYLLLWVNHDSAFGYYYYLIQFLQ